MTSEVVDPLTRISDNFLLSDFLGNHTVYSCGIPNGIAMDRNTDLKMNNVAALCREGLERMLEKWGPLSISYGHISDTLSRKIVKYQNPDMPSHHRFDLGAAADVISHKFVTSIERQDPNIEDLFVPVSAAGSPILLAHSIDIEDIPYSRLITYSESPYVCLAISAEESRTMKPRKAFYENRYEGMRGAKPAYLRYPTANARIEARNTLIKEGLPFEWQGGGYPTYHGGGRRQYHHTRISKYTMLSDWLFDLQSIANGARNIPEVTNESVQDSLAAAGMTYDMLVDISGVQRLSIIGGYVSRTNKFFDASNDWRDGSIYFDIAVHEASPLLQAFPSLHGVTLSIDDSYTTEGSVIVRVYVDVAQVFEANTL